MPETEPMRNQYRVNFNKSTQLLIDTLIDEYYNCSEKTEFE